MIINDYYLLKQNITNMLEYIILTNIKYLQGRPQDFSQGGAIFIRNKTLSGIRNKSRKKGNMTKYTYIVLPIFEVCSFCKKTGWKSRTKVQLCPPPLLDLLFRRPCR